MFSFLFQGSSTQFHCERGFLGADTLFLGKQHELLEPSWGGWPDSWPSCPEGEALSSTVREVFPPTQPIGSNQLLHPKFSLFSPTCLLNPDSGKLDQNKRKPEDAIPISNAITLEHLQGPWWHSFPESTQHPDLRGFLF